MKLEIIFLVVLILAILWGIQWMFHGFPAGSWMMDFIAFKPE